MITILNDTVKPVYNAFKMWSMLGEYVVSTQCDDPRLGVIASIGRDRITILLWNFNTYESRAKEKVVDLKIRGIKFENDFFMRRYLIDATHSNGLYSKYKQWPECVENKKIRRTEDLTLEINMEPYSVSLIVLSPVEKKSVAPIVQVDCPEVVSDSITLKIKATDDGFITLVEYRIDNEEWDRIDNKEKDTYRIRLDASTIQEGNYQISVRVFDNEGNETNIKKEIAVGPTPPGINLVFVFVLLAILIIILIAVLLKRKKGAKK
jgi:subtilase family serine protease